MKKASRKKKVQAARRTALYRSDVAMHTPPAIRQSVTIPGELAELIKRKKQQDESISKVLLRYVRLGLTEEQRARRRLRVLVWKIQAAATPEEAERLYGDEFIETIFGPQEARAKD